MNTYHLVMAVPAYALLVWAAVADVRSGRIANWLTVGLATSGLVQSALPWGPMTTAQSLLGLCVGFSLGFALFTIGALGGGDVKLLAGMGAWLGPSGAFALFLAAAIVGMMIVLAQSATQGTTRRLLRNSAAIAVGLAHLRVVGVDHVRATGKSCRGVDRPLPYAVPVLIAALLVGLAGV